MRDISNELNQLIQDKQCSSLLAFIMVENNELHLSESESCKEDCRGLRDKSDIDNN